MHRSMSDVEALLSVDAGKVPPGVVAFFARDPEASKRRVLAAFAVVMAGVTAAAYWAALNRPSVALLALATLALIIQALPPERDPETARYKRPTLVVTPSGVIVRDGSGLRSWTFEDLVDVRPYLHQQRIGLLLAKRDGSREFVDTLSFERGETVTELIGRRLKPREV
ncbi:MAG TPA: hypothetical protein VHO67_23785 [Polyangia bacterium]|nr:hypothetical protein [Polyangia bacterium]